MKGRTVVLCAGDFPAKGGEAERILLSAERVVACDSAASEFYRRFRRWPDVTIGDLDSLPASLCQKMTPPPVEVRDQSVNDFGKAVAYCAGKGWRNPIVAGATGGREDHTIGNVFRALDEGLRIVADRGEFLPVRGVLNVRVWPGTGLSVFVSDPRTRMKSRGLQWKLDGVRFENVYAATLNRAIAENVRIESDRPAFLYVERNPVAKRFSLSFGSNLGDRVRNLSRALSMVSRLHGVRLLDASEVVETEPVGVPRRFSNLKFLNQAAVFETLLEPLELSRAVHAIEDRLGRVRTVRNGPRTIDIDIIDFEGVRMKTRELEIPHPRAARREFVATPLREIGVAVPEVRGGRM